MAQWALLSGIQGNLRAYEAVMSDLRSGSIEAIYILGDLVGPTSECEQLVERVRQPKPGELHPQVCLGWWEEQCFILHGLAQTADPVELKSQESASTIKALWQSVSTRTVEWLRTLHFGFLESECLLIHGSTVSVSDCLTPDTEPLTMWDRVVRGEAQRLFCGRSGLAFDYRVVEGSITDQVTTLAGQQPLASTNAQMRQVIGVGSVGRVPGRATYTLYTPDTGSLQFKQVTVPES